MKINGKAAKAAQPLKVGDRVACYVHERQRDLEVVRLLSKRVGAPVAVECYVDHSPAPPGDDHSMPSISRAAGRPSKRDRRQLDRLRGR